MRWACLISALLILLHAQPTAAFYSWQGEQGKGDARLLLRGFIIASQKPANPLLQEKRNEEAPGGVARLIAQSDGQHRWTYEFNAYQTYIDESLVSEHSSLATVLDVERSGVLEWDLSDDKYAHLAIDRLNARWSSENLDIRIGRQAINLGTTFFFSPNDFFAPFDAQAFYRVYKPGVDAIRGDYSLSELNTFSLMAVQGYQPQAGTDSGWSDSPEASRNSYLARYLTNLAGFEWGLIAGKVRRANVLGGSISGEMFDWLGIRVEGHQQKDLDNYQPRLSKVSMGFEHRWKSSLMVQLELYYHGSGATEVASYDNNQTYTARRYQAVGLAYEFTPLLSTEFSVLHNQVDNSRLYTLYAVYSLSNESELEMTLSIPDGEAPEGQSIKSEFGSYSRVFNLELRAYF